jgi:glycerol uptake facilitator protein
MDRNWLGQYINEVIGTYILILFGCGSVVVSILTGAFGLFGVAILWGFAVMFGVYWAGAVSSAHINPAVTVSMATWGDFPWRRVPGYVAAQLSGAFLAAATLWFTWLGWYQQFFQNQGIQPGEPGSSLSGMTLWTFAPNPAFAGVGAGEGGVTTMADVAGLVSPAQWFFSEVVITAILVAAIFAMLDEDSDLGVTDDIGLFAIGVGFLVAMLVQYEAPISMAALNPARDLGPRVFGLLVGYGEVAFPGPRGLFWMPTVSTVVGGLVGGGVYQYATASFHDIGEQPEPTSDAEAEAAD